MLWDIVSEDTEKVEDPNPDTWVRSAEYSLMEKKIDEALEKLDKAINYSENNTKYIKEKIKVLDALKRYDECVEMLNKYKSHINLDKDKELGQYIYNILNNISKSNEDICELLINLYDLGMYKEFVEIVEKKLYCIRNDIKAFKFDNLMEIYLKAINSVNDEDIPYYLNKIFILYKMGFYDKFLEAVESRLSNKFNNKNKSVVGVLLEYVDNSIKYISDNKKYYFIKAKILFCVKAYNECSSEILTRFQYYNYNQKLYAKNYLRDCLINDNNDNMELYNKILFFFNNNMFEEFLQVVKIKINNFKKNIELYQFKKILDDFYKAMIKNNFDDGKDIYHYSTSLYNYGELDKFINVIDLKGNYNTIILMENDIDILKKTTDAIQWDKIIHIIYRNLLNLTEKYTFNKEKMYEKIIFFFKNKKYDEFINLLYYMEFYDFTNLLYKNIEQFKDELNKDQFKRLLTYIFDKIKLSNAPNENIYRHILKYCTYLGPEKTVKLFRYNSGSNFVPYIKNDIGFFETKLDKDNFNELLQYIYSKLKKDISSNNVHKFECIKLLYNYNKYNQCIELFKKNIHSFLKNCTFNEYKQIVICWAKCYFKSGRILEGILFLLTGSIKYRDKYGMTLISTIVLALIIMCKTNMLYEIGMLKPEIINITPICDKNTMDKDEEVVCTIKVDTKPKGIKNLQFNLKTLDSNIVNYTKNKGMVFILHPKNYGKGKIVVEVFGKNHKVVQKTIEVKKAQVLEIKGSISKNTIKVGQHSNISHKLKMNYHGAKEKSIRYISSNSNIVSVDDLGNIIGIGVGKASITLVSGDKKDRVYIYVVKNEKYENHENYEEYGNYDNGTINKIYNNDIIPKSSVELLKTKDIFNFDIDKLWLARNEIFARHGFIFENNQLKEYFENKPWYHENYEVKGILEELNPIEKDNLRCIKQLENIKMAYNYRPYDIDREYIFPNSSCEKISKQQLENLSDWEIIIARNEIFAKYGFIFGIPELIEYFNNKNWYVEDHSYNGDIQNEIEEHNIDVIKEVEEERFEEMIKKYH